MMCDDERLFEDLKRKGLISEEDADFFLEDFGILEKRHNELKYKEIEVIKDDLLYRFGFSI